MNTVKPIPAGMSTVTPHLVCHSAADAILFYIKAFGAVELSRIPGQDGRLMHALIRIGNSQLMLVDEFSERGLVSPTTMKGSPVTLHLYVEDADAFVAEAVKAGARITQPVAEMFWGDRYGRLIDPYGHQWSVATRVRDVSAEEIEASAARIWP